ncbi:MAG: hypothetical protein GY762_09575 [Proteobacteria bacterium]|nr:hypothetical protein [Pseudomonadota bacterium]
MFYRFAIGVLFAAQLGHSATALGQDDDRFADFEDFYGDSETADGTDQTESGDASHDDDRFAGFEDFDETSEKTDQPVDVEKKSEINVRIHGSFENQLTGMLINQYQSDSPHLVLNNYTRLRVDLDVDLPGGLKLRSDVVALLYVGETRVKMVDLIPEQTIDDLYPHWSAIFNESHGNEYHVFGNQYYIDNVYLKIPVSTLLFIVGKQPLEQGAGYVWNPTNVFNEKKLLDPTYEQVGIIAGRLILPIGDIASFDLVAVPNNKFTSWIGGGRASLRISRLSLSAATYVTQAERTDWEGSIDRAAEAGLDPASAVHVSRAQRVMVGGDAVLDIKGVRIWAEGAYNFVEDKQGAPDDWWELVAGMEYFFPFETHIMVEYFHYSLGPRQRGGTYSFNSWMGFFSNDLLMLGTDFLFEAIDHPVADFWIVGLSSFQSLSDFSASIMADVRWEFVQDAELWFLIAVNIGDDEDFLSATEGQGWLRLRVFF